MTIHFPDVFSGQAGISFHGAPACIVKATQGTTYTNPDFAPAKARAASAGAFLMAYHFLEAGNAAAQAAHCYSVAGDVPLMLDMEADGGNPAVSDAVAFIDHYRALGGTCYLLYLPHWYWHAIGSPSLAPLISRGMLIVSSNYTTYSDTGPGWAPYGGMTPVIWQYTSSATFGGRSPVDMNAFKGTIGELRSLAMTGSIAPAPAAPQWPAGVVLQFGSSGDPVRALQQALHDSGLRGVRGIAVDGDFGPQTLQAVEEFQMLQRIGIDGIAGPRTRGALIALGLLTAAGTAT